MCKQCFPTWWTKDIFISSCWVTSNIPIFTSAISSGLTSSPWLLLQGWRPCKGLLGQLEEAKNKMNERLKYRGCNRKSPPCKSYYSKIIMPEGTLTINTLLALISCTKALQKEVGKRTLMKIFTAQTQEGAELPPVCPAFPESWSGQNNGVSLCTLPSPAQAARMLWGSHSRDLPSRERHRQGSGPRLPHVPQ